MLLRCCLPLLLLGCDPDCPDASEVDGSWLLTAVVLSHEGGDEPGFPSYRSPSNGTRSWTLQWGDLDDGPVSVGIDGNALDAAGSWDPASCGGFQIELDGVYDSPSGSRHALDASLHGVLWEGHLDGTFTWSESWTDRTGESSGSYAAEGRFDAVRE